MLIKLFALLISVFYFSLCNAEQHVYENNTDFTVPCKKNRSCQLIYNENSYVVLSSIKSEPSNIYFENEVYNIVYSCGSSCVKYVFFKKPNTVSDVYLNSLAISDKGEFVLTMYGNLVQVYETFTYKKKLDNGGDILSNGSFNDAGYEGGKFFIRHRTIGGNYSEEKISIK